MDHFSYLIFKAIEINLNNLIVVERVQEVIL
jgi:hypothetical protein